jgi:hypothetical protein
MPAAASLHYRARQLGLFRTPVRLSLCRIRVGTAPCVPENFRERFVIKPKTFSNQIISRNQIVPENSRERLVIKPNTFSNQIISRNKNVPENSRERLAIPLLSRNKNRSRIFSGTIAHPTQNFL